MRLRWLLALANFSHLLAYTVAFVGIASSSSYCSSSSFAEHMNYLQPAKVIWLQLVKTELICLYRVPSQANSVGRKSKTKTISICNYVCVSMCVKKILQKQKWSEIFHLYSTIARKLII